MRSWTLVIAGAGAVACGPSTTFILAPEGIDWVAGFGTSIAGDQISTPLAPVDGGAELSFDPPPSELTLVGLSEQDLYPFEAQRARWTVDRVLPVQGCELRLPPARWATVLGEGDEASMPIAEVPRLTALWLDEERRCDHLDIQVEVQCGAVPSLCLPREERVGRCRFDVLMCSQVGGQRLVVELEDEARACALEARDCLTGVVDGKLVFTCPPHAGVACSATVHAHRPAAPALRVLRELRLPGDTPYAPSSPDPVKQERDLLSLDEADLGLGQDLVVVGDQLVVLARPDGRGGVAPNTAPGCPVPEPRSFLFFDAADGARRPELDRPAPDCATWLAPAEEGFFGLRSHGPEDFVVSHFDRLGAETASTSFSTASIRQGGRVRMLPPIAGPGPNQLIVAIRRGELEEGVVPGASWLMLFERDAGGSLRMVWRQDFGGIDDDTELQSVAVLDERRVVAIDGAADQFYWFDADTGRYLGAARVQPFEARGLRYGFAMSDRAAGRVYVPVGQGRAGLIALDSSLVQTGRLEFVEGVPLTALGPAPGASWLGAAFLFDPSSGRARVTRLLGESSPYLDPGHVDLGEGGPVRRVQPHGTTLWALRPWSGALVQLAPEDDRPGP